LSSTLTAGREKLIECRIAGCSSWSSKQDSPREGEDMKSHDSLRQRALATIVCFACLAGWENCSAQVARYQPSTPTVSPYLNLTRFNGGGLPNYYALVRPQIQQRDFNLRGRALQNQQTREIVTLQNEVTRGLEPSSATGTGSWFQIPGTRTSVLDTRRYYPEPALGGRGR
jgi:hypothetical protein